MEFEPIKTKYIVEYRLKGRNDWKYYNASSNKELARKFMYEAMDLDGVIESRLRAKFSQSQIVDIWEKGNLNG